MKVCRECYGDSDLYYGCTDCGRPPRHHLIPLNDLLGLHAREVAAGREPVMPVWAPGVLLSVVAVRGTGVVTVAFPTT